MNINIIFSFVVGGLLLLALLVLNARVLRNSGETTLSMTAKRKVETINEIMRRDFTRLGYNVNGSGCGDGDDSAAIITAADNTFTFCADLDNIESTQAYRITWQFSPAAGTPNPDDFVLSRTTAASAGASRFTVYQFRSSPYFRYMDEDGTTTAAEDQISSFTVSFQTQSPVKYADGSYKKAFLQATFSPPNLNLYTYQ